MPRENAQAKARRYLAEARLIVTAVNEHQVTAICRGGGALYELRFGRGGWSCTCPAKTTCSHLIALQLVTAPRGRS